MKKSNLEIKDGCVVLSINPKVYPLEVIYSAAYVFLDRAYILLDGDPKKEIFIELKPKNKENLEKLGREFNNELINYADYRERAKQTKKIREILLQRALITNDPCILKNDERLDDTTEELEDGKDYLDDPEGIAIPWEEKHGNNAKKKKSKK
ncbi:MAG: His-Xaa-Ser system protein HxsD [Nanoarchaeota archaeon]|nr:His-Xaa-Ser system protein HxsD [Nanoarchaeota archaeon]